MQLKGQVRAGSKSHTYKGSLWTTGEETDFWLIWDYTTYTLGEKEHVCISQLLRGGVDLAITTAGREQSGAVLGGHLSLLPHTLQEQQHSAHIQQLLCRATLHGSWLRKADWRLSRAKKKGHKECLKQCLNSDETNKWPIQIRNWARFCMQLSLCSDVTCSHLSDLVRLSLLRC